MKRALVTAAATLLLFTPALAQLKPCDELKSEIEEKIKKNGVQTFTLDVVPKGEAAKSEAPKEGAKEGDAKKEGAAGEGQVVGTCEGGTKQILYKK
jgi:uncharacterized protein DUF1161